MVVSNPLLGTVTKGWSVCGLLPARTCHETVWVVPFQLAYTVVAPPPAVAATAGGVTGLPFHDSRNARYCAQYPTKRASKTMCPWASNSVKYGGPPQATKLWPLARS